MHFGLVSLIESLSFLQLNRLLSTGVSRIWIEDTSIAFVSSEHSKMNQKYLNRSQDEKSKRVKVWLRRIPPICMSGWCRPFQKKFSWINLSHTSVTLVSTFYNFENPVASLPFISFKHFFIFLSHSP